MSMKSVNIGIQYLHIPSHIAVIMIAPVTVCGLAELCVLGYDADSVFSVCYSLYFSLHTQPALKQDGSQDNGTAGMSPSSVRERRSRVQEV